jgi:predicted O-methyltransferase YrrM
MTAGGPADLLRSLALRLRFPRHERIPTHLTPAEKLALLRLAGETPGGGFVEIGSYLGASACYIAAGIRRAGSHATLYCVDTWRNDAMTEGSRDTYAAFIENTRGYRDTIVPLRGASADVAGSFDRPVDFLFVDGDHSYDGVRADVDAWLPRLAPGATVVFHDIGWADGVARVVREEIAPRAVSEGRLPNLYWARLSAGPRRAAR